MTALLDRPTPPPGAEDDASGETPSRSPGWWGRPALAVLLATTGVLYIWNLAESGYANTFYAAAAQAGSQSWTAWFFGSLDSSNFITVDKPPAALWVTGLSVRMFGMNSWAVLVPQSLMGVAAVALVYCAMRRTFTDRVHGTAAGLIAGAVLAFTPAAALIFRFNNPDALLVLLMVAAGYALIRAVATNSTRWLALVGVALGFAFLTKMLQGLLVLPAFGLAYLLLANTSWLKRAGQLAIATVSLVVSAGWFVVVTMIVPESARPYIGGSEDNTFMNLVLGYNGIGRISGGEGGGPGGGGGGGMVGAGGSFGGETGLSRLFSSEMGNEISWLLPTALIALVFAAYLGVRTLRNRELVGGLSRLEVAAVVAWGGWLIVTAIVFSYMSGTIHPYYTVALAPAIACLVGLGSAFAWRRRDHWDGRVAIAAMLAAASAWSIILLNRSDFGPVWCRWLIGAVAVVSVLAVVIGGTLGWRKAVDAAVIAGVLAGFGGTAAFSIATAATAHSGSIPTAVNTSMESGMGGPRGGMGGPGGKPGGRSHHSSDTRSPERPGGRGGGMSGGPGGAGMSDNTELAALLRATTTTWAAAVNGSQSASGIEIATGKAVMAIGGWSGDPAPTLDEFKEYVAAGQIAYYVGGESGRSGSSEISEWVAANFSATTVGDTTVYTLT